MIALTLVLHHVAGSGLFGADSVSRRKNVGKSAPSRPRRCMWDKAFPWGTMLQRRGKRVPLQEVLRTARLAEVQFVEEVQATAFGCSGSRQPPGLTERTIEANRLRGGARQGDPGQPRGRTEGEPARRTQSRPQQRDRRCPVAKPCTAAPAAASTGRCSGVGCGACSRSDSGGGSRDRVEPTSYPLHNRTASSLWRHPS